MSYKIFLVEDNILNLKLFTDLLNMKGYNVIVSSDGYNLLNKILIEKPELILMDIQLSGISGINLIQEIKKNINTKHIPIIAISAFTFTKEVNQIIESGCDKYIAKPVIMNDFYKAIEELLPHQ